MRIPAVACSAAWSIIVQTKSIWARRHVRQAHKMELVQRAVTNATYSRLAKAERLLLLLPAERQARVQHQGLRGEAWRLLPFEDLADNPRGEVSDPCQSASKKDPPSASKRDPLSSVHRPTVSPGAEP